MGFNAEAECDKLETQIKNLTTRLTTLENSIKSQTEAKISNKIEALEKNIAALKATDERDGDTVKKLEEKMSKELQSHREHQKEDRCGRRRRPENRGQNGVPKREEALDLEYKVRDAVNHKDLENFMETKSKSYAAERKAQEDGHARQFEEFKKQSEAQYKHMDDEIKQQEAKAKQINAEAMKEVTARIAQLQKEQDTARLEARLKVLEAQITAMGKG